MCIDRMNLLAILAMAIVVAFSSEHISCQDSDTTSVASSGNPFLKRYTKLTYDTNALHEHHRRAKRSAPSDDNRIHLSFESHGKKFRLVLSPLASGTFFDTQNVEIATIASNGPSSSTSRLVDDDDFQLYEGRLADEPHTSSVFGTIIDGIFIGTINSPKHGKFYVESSKRYEVADEDAHAIVYHEDDVNSAEHVKANVKAKAARGDDEYDEDSLNGAVGCGSTHKTHRDTLSHEQRHVSEHAAKQQQQQQQREQAGARRVVQVGDANERASFKYSASANSKKTRSKRASGTQIPFPNSQSVCNLYLRTDPYLYQTIYQSEGNKNDKTTQNFLIYYMTQQVSAINAIYTPAKFTVNGSNYYTGVKFSISRIKIYNINQCDSGSSTLSSTEANMCIKYLDPTNFLSYLSLENYTDYCTAFTFTSRDFGDGTLGLAWLATPSTSVGGICSKPVQINSVYKSLNSGMVTVVSFNARVPDIVQHITFAHEMGHNFGSTHDLATNTACAPGGTQGNYIMYSRATSGKAANNDEFSSCSLNLIGLVIDYIVNGEKNCFKTVNQTSAVCGNGVVEDSEECDYSVFGDKCCTTECKLAAKPGGSANATYACSPSKGPCCTDECTFKAASEVCLTSSDCSGSITCSGSSALCPTTNYTANSNSTANTTKPDGAYCNNNTQTCLNGKCAGSLCAVYSGLSECTLTGDLSSSSTDKFALCLVACTGASTGNTCKPTSSIDAFGGRQVSLRAGTPCAGTQGYCDMFGRCRAVDEEGPFSRLTSSLIGILNLTASDVASWAVDNWWALLIFALLFIAFNILVLVCIVRHIDSDNPEHSQRESLLDTLTSPFNLCRPKDKIKTRASAKKGDNGGVKSSSTSKSRRLRQDSIRPVDKEPQRASTIPSISGENTSDVHEMSAAPRSSNRSRRKPKPRATAAAAAAAAASVDPPVRNDDDDDNNNQDNDEY